MKKTRITVLLVVLALLCSVFTLTACGGGPRKLDPPVVVLVGDTATWSANDLADKFEISVDGNLSYIENSVTNRKLTDGQTFKIRAVGDGIDYKTSSWSNSVTYEKEGSLYTITWKNGDEVLEIDENVKEGTVPTYDGAVPTKASDAQYSYEFAGWSPQIVTVEGNATYTAVFNSVLKKYSVKFYYYDGTLIEEQIVEYGKDAVPSVEPERAGYLFVGWDKSYENVSQDLEITAKFEEAVKVEFVDYNGMTIYWEYIVKGGDVTNIPEAPTRMDYKFTGWDVTDFNNITEDIRVTAQYVQTCRVAFIDYDGSLIDSQNVVIGESAQTPSNPLREGYKFVGWDKDFSNITSHTTVNAKYEINEYEVTFTTPTGIVIETKKVKHGYATVAPNVDDKYFHIGDKNELYGYEHFNGYYFTRWSDSFDNITSDKTIVAVYGEKITDVIVVAESVMVKTATNVNVELNIYVANGNKPCGISLDVQLSPELLNGGLPEINVDGNKTEDGTEYYESKLNNEGLYTFRWTKDSGITNDTMVTFNFTLNKGGSGKYLVDILDSTYVITSSIEKITPVIISGYVVVNQ
ncbi:MAG: InlB B-repeat-containing protein [Clostridia bacterium]|nr:InlB B-repeat-containing protein [Clostridia bacterium]